MDEFNTINHCLFKGIVVFFVTKRELEREQFEKCIRLLQEKANIHVADDSLLTYWQAMSERMEGESRWDKVSPIVEEGSSPDWRRRAHLSQNEVSNIPQKRPYVAFSISGIQYVLDVFNPRNELGIQYPGAGQPVLALIMGEEVFGNIFDRLAENSDFYQILRGLASICDAEPIVGMNSGNLASLMRAYYYKDVDPATEPWSFLFPLSVMRLPKPIGGVALNRYFKKIEDWGDGRFLLQVKSGIDFSINRQNADAAKILGMTPVQDLNPDVLKERRS